MEKWRERERVFHFIVRVWSGLFVTAQKQFYIPSCNFAFINGFETCYDTKEDVIPCDDFKCQGVLSSFDLLLNSNKVVQEGCLRIFLCCMHAPLTPNLA